MQRLVEAKDIRRGDVFAKERELDVYEGKSGYKVVSTDLTPKSIKIRAVWVTDNGVVTKEEHEFVIRHQTVLALKGA